MTAVFLAPPLDRFELARFAADFLEDAPFLLAGFFFDAFFLDGFFWDGRFVVARAFLPAFFLAVAFFLEDFFLATRDFFAAFLDVFLEDVFFAVLRFDEGRAAVFATRFFRDGFFEAVFLPLGLLLAAAFFVGIEFASNGRVQKTRDYT